MKIEKTFESPTDMRKFLAENKIMFCERQNENGKIKIIYEERNK